MNTKEYVQLTGDANDIPVKYMVMEATIGANAAGSYLWLKCASYGMDSLAHFQDYLDSLDDDTVISGGTPTGIQGTLGAYSVVALTAVEEYNSPKTHHNGPYKIG
jgi:hypothetical protein